MFCLDPLTEGIKTLQINRSKICMTWQNLPWGKAKAEVLYVSWDLLLRFKNNFFLQKLLLLAQMEKSGETMALFEGISLGCLYSSVILSVTKYVPLSWLQIRNPQSKMLSKVFLLNDWLSHTSVDTFDNIPCDFSQSSRPCLEGTYSRLSHL